jgi:hypothetical protein
MGHDSWVTVANLTDQLAGTDLTAMLAGSVVQLHDQDEVLVKHHDQEMKSSAMPTVSHEKERVVMSRVQKF